MNEIQKTSNLLNYKFKLVDTNDDGSISIQHFKNIIRATKFLTPKEQNLLIRLQKSDVIKYNDFPDMLFNVRYEIAVSEMMENKMDDIEMNIRKEFAKYDADLIY